MKLLLPIAAALATFVFTISPNGQLRNESELGQGAVHVRSDVDNPATRKADAQQDITVTITLGNQITNVGDHQGPALYSIVWNALDVLTSSNNPPISTVTVSQKYYLNDALHDDLLVISFDVASWTSDALRKLMIGSIAGAAQKSSEDVKNCYRWVVVNRANPSHGTFCAMGSFIDVEAGDGNYIYARFQAKNRGTFDCVAIIEQTNKYLETLLPEYNNALSSEDAKGEVVCPNREVTHGDDS